MQNVNRWFFWPFLKSILKHYSVFGIYHVCNIIFQRSMCYHHNWKLNKVQLFCLSQHSNQPGLLLAWTLFLGSEFETFWKSLGLQSFRESSDWLLHFYINFWEHRAERCVMIGQNYLATNDGRSFVHLLI